MSAARKIVREGGAIVMVAACQDGLPAHGGYAAFLREAGSPERVLEMVAQPGFHRHDQWTVQVADRKTKRKGYCSAPSHAVEIDRTRTETTCSKQATSVQHQAGACGGILPHRKQPLSLGGMACA